MLDHKLLHVQLSFWSTLTHKWGLETTDFISNSCIFSWLVFQRGSCFCPLAQVKTFLTTLSFSQYYVDLDYIVHGSATEAGFLGVWCHVMVVNSIQAKGLPDVFTKTIHLSALMETFSSAPIQTHKCGPVAFHCSQESVFSNLSSELYSIQSWCIQCMMVCCTIRCTGCGLKVSFRSTFIFSATLIADWS